MTAAAFISGAIVMAYLVAALYFLRFWRETRDRLFVFFTAAFVALAVQRSLLTLLQPQEGTLETALYVLRLAAFLSIVVGIVDKNRKG